MGAAITGQVGVALLPVSRRVPSSALPLPARRTTIRTRRPPHLRFGIGAIPIKATTLRYPNARFRGERLFSNVYQNPCPAWPGLSRYSPVSGVDSRYSRRL